MMLGQSDRFSESVGFALREGPGTRRPLNVPQTYPHDLFKEKQK
jgi:hypothetical protein